MPDRIGMICFDLPAHREDHAAAEQTDHALDNDESGIGHPVFSEIPRLEMIEEEIGFAQQA